MKYFTFILLAIGSGTFAFAQEKVNQPSNFTAGIVGVNIVGREPLFFVSLGESTREVTYEEFSKIDTRRMSSVHVLKGQDAIGRYGDRARYGAIIVTMKGSSFSENYPGKKKTDK